MGTCFASRYLPLCSCELTQAALVTAAMAGYHAAVQILGLDMHTDRGGFGSSWFVAGSVLVVGACCFDGSLDMHVHIQVVSEL